jgi:tryptophan-rich sensory protein
MTLTIVVAAVITILLLGVGGALTDVGVWYRSIAKPSWNPPDWLFGPAWTVILGLAAWAGVLAWTHATGEAAHVEIGIMFGVNIFFHLLWSPLFFNMRRPDWALIEAPFLWFSVLALVIGLAPYSTLAAWLVVPYLLWVSFATFLNWTIVRMNPPFTGRAVTASKSASAGG